MILVCGNCRNEFTASKAQERRSRWPAMHPKTGFCCSAQCRSALGVKGRKGGRLCTRKLAYSRVSNALDSGKLVRPEACERCGRNPGCDGLGRSRLEAHHEDHSRALDVVWLCDGCHKDISPVARGEAANKSDLTESDVVDIRRMRAEGLTGREIAGTYCVTHKTVFDIEHRRTWDHVL